MTLIEFQAKMSDLNQWAQHGCTDSNCRIERTPGMATNGGCQCSPRAFAEHLLALACELDKGGKYARWEPYPPTPKENP